MNLQGFSIRHLAVLDMLLTERHVGRAADRLGLSQPAVSNTLAWLRTHFGDALLLRSGGALRLTPFATRLREPVRRLLLDFRAVASNRPVFDPATADQRFRIVMSHYLCALFLSPLLAHFAATAPYAAVDVARIDGDIHEFGRGEVDLVIVPQEWMFPYKTWEPLFSDRWVCVGWAGAWPADTVMDVARFTAARHIVPDMPNAIRQDFGDLSIERDVAAVVPQALLLRAVVGTPWLVTVPERFVAAAGEGTVGGGDLRTFPLPFATNRVDIAQQWHPEASDDASIVWLRQMVRQAIAIAGITTSE